MLGHLGTILGPPWWPASSLKMVILRGRSLNNGFVCCPLVVLSQRVNKTFPRPPQDEAKVHFLRTSHAKTQFMLNRKAILGHAGPSWDHLGTTLGACVELENGDFAWEVLKKWLCVLSFGGVKPTCEQDLPKTAPR